MFRDSLEYPTKGEDLSRKYLIGTLLGLGSIFLIPAFFLIGYFVKATRKSAEGAEQIPKFEDFTSLFVDGLKATGVMLSYPLGAVLVIATLDSAGQMTGTTAIMDAVGLIILLLSIYIVPSGIARFARTESLKAAFTKQVVDTAFTRRYLVGILTIIAAVIVITLGQLAALIILMITIIGIPAIIFVLPAMRFYENLVYFRIFAEMTESTD